ncbi:MAG: CPBP family intramembrane glutamic endopeptidase [Promethearchaeia archaeon]
MTEENNNTNDNKIKWQFCPVCGKKLPKVEGLRYCISCGIDLKYLKENKKLPISYDFRENNIGSFQYQYNFPNASYQDYSPYTSPTIITYENEKAIWSTKASILLPLLAFVVMNSILIGIMVILFLFSPNMNTILNLINNPYFIVISSLIEIILFIIPVVYIRKFYPRTSWKNRFKILGFTKEGYTNLKLLKEVSIGLGFAVLGLFLVAGSTILIRFIIEWILGIKLRTSSDQSNSDIDYFLKNADIFSLIALVAVMIFIVGTSEEILFRGFMQRGLVRTLGETAGILITAFIFASIHLVSLFLIGLNIFSLIINLILMFVPYFSISLMLGLLFKWRKENLIANVIAHGVYNSLTLIIAFIYFTAF